VASGPGKSTGKPWALLMVEKASKQIWPQMALSSGVAGRIRISGCDFGGIGQGVFGILEQGYQRGMRCGVCRAPPFSLWSSLIATLASPAVAYANLSVITVQLYRRFERRQPWPARCNFAPSVKYSQAWEHEFFVCEGRSPAIPHGPQWRGPSSFLEVLWPSF
jgi:hypothetical protein